MSPGCFLNEKGHFGGLFVFVVVALPNRCKRSYKDSMRNLMSKLQTWFSANGVDAGLLVLRVGTGLVMAFAHGLAKLQNFGPMSQRFLDPIGLGAPFALSMAIFAELVCSLLIAVGLFTRLAALPFVITMLTAVFVAHGGDPWADKEAAFMFLVPGVAVLLAGPGRFSVDALIRERRSKSA